MGNGLYSLMHIENELVIEYYLKSAKVFYCKAKLHVIIDNAQKNLLTVTSAMSALLFPALD